MTFPKYLLNIILIQFINLCCTGQDRPTFKLDMYNGLPSNCVYMTLKDNAGYLWIATNKGLVKYNGYTPKIFPLADTYPNNEVFGLFLDKKDRMWLYGFSSSIGYIKNNQHHTIPFAKKRLVYPKHISDFRNGVMFLASSENNTNVVFTEENDTIKEGFAGYGGHVVASSVEKILSLRPVYKNTSYDVRCYNGRTFEIERQCPVDDTMVNILDDLPSSLPFKHYIIFYTPKHYSLFVRDFNNCQWKTISYNAAADELVSYAYVIGAHLYIIYEKHIAKLDSNLNTVNIFSIEGQIHNSYITGLKINHFNDDNFWQNCISTEKEGLIFNVNSEFKFIKKELDLIEYAFLGYSADGRGYWWNTYTNTLARVDPQGTATYQKMLLKREPKKIIPYSTGRSILMADKVYWLDNNTLKIKNIRADNKLPTTGEMPGFRGLDGYTMDSANVYLLFTGGVYLKDLTTNTFTADQIDVERFNNITYDAFRHIVYIYHNEKILVYKKGKKKLYLLKDQLLKGGIKGIDQILVDKKFGNILLKDRNKLFCINPEINTITELLQDHNLAEAKINLQNETLIVAGKFGVVFTKITGTNKFSPPVILKNYKNWYYTSLYDIQVFEKSLLLKTDKGSYTIQRPEEHDYVHHNKLKEQPYIFILGYNAKTSRLGSNDTFTIDRNNNTVQFDIINPAGNGKVIYSCFIKGVDTAWRDLNADELNLPPLTPGTYYAIYIRAQDDVWKSRLHQVSVYITPKWWETKWGRRSVFLISVVLLGLFAYVIVVITQKRVAKKSAKRTRLLELEIRSVYSQINPHFIFNTLNGALYFIKKQRLDEAYTHIFKFSKLLRSYLSSSQNKLVTIEKEMENIRTYIELQQTRFANAFQYTITSNITDADKVEIPSLLLQPIVENAINHGLVLLEGPGNLTISFLQDTGTGSITCIVEDDGVGRKTSKEHYGNDIVKKESYGTKLIEELISLHNEYKQMGIEIKYIDKTPPYHGTIVRTTIKHPHRQT